MNASGAADKSADDSTPVLIQVQDSPADSVHPTVTFTLTGVRSEVPLTTTYATSGGTVWIRTHVSNAPPGAKLTYLWEEEGWHNRHPETGSIYAALSPDQAKDVTYTVHVKWPRRRYYRQTHHPLDFPIVCP